MCGIFVILPPAGTRWTAAQLARLRAIAVAQARKLRHRGPDWSGVHACPAAVVAHERLGLVDPTSGAQPLYSAPVPGAAEGTPRRYVLAVNGEIYNHAALRALFPSYEFQTGSDCEVVLPMFADHVEAPDAATTAAAAADAPPPSFLEQLSGMFGFVVVDTATGRFLVARDAIGIIPLYFGSDKEGNLYIASEMKALVDVCDVALQEFPPGHYIEGGFAAAAHPAPRRYYEREWTDYGKVRDGPTTPAGLRASLSAAVHSHLMCDVPYGVLLSGGLDSSIIAALAQQHAAMRVESGDTQAAWYPRLHSFAIGLKGSPDLVAARAAAEHIGTVHHEMHFTVQEGLDALDDVVYHVETYDVTTIRASTPMFLLARKIKAMGIKMVLSGEGADELFGGYLYFHKAPTPRDFHEETVRKLQKLHMFDCARANKALAAWGVEGRVPFLDKDFVDAAMRLPPREKFIGALPDDEKVADDSGRDRPAIEKRVLRQQFDDVLPASIAWRQKEQFSDGVGYSWIDSLKAHAEAAITDAELAKAAVQFPHNTPATKEALLFRRMFARHFPTDASARCVPGGKSVACSTPEALAWDASLRSCAADPSGRAVASVHVAALAA